MRHGGRVCGPLFRFARRAATLGAALLLLVLPASCVKTYKTELIAEIVPLEAPDGTPIQLVLAHENERDAAEARFKAVIIAVHDEGKNNDGWAVPSITLHREGYAVARWDLRGHGRSSLNSPYTGFGDADWAKCADDLAMVVHAVRERVRPETPIIVAGEGYGGLLALDCARHHDGIAGVVMVSPPREAHGLDGVALVKDFEACPILILASENDTTRYPAAMAIKDAAPAFSEIRVYPGSARGTDLLAEKPDAMQQFAGWLDVVLGTPADVASHSEGSLQYRPQVSWAVPGGRSS